MTIDTLSDLLIVQILESLEWDIDKICVLVVCKKLYSIREKIRFNICLPSTFESCALVLDQLRSPYHPLYSFHKSIHKGIDDLVILNNFTTDRYMTDRPYQTQTPNVTKFIYNLNRPIPDGLFLLPTITNLTLGGFYDFDINLVILPPSLKSLTICRAKHYIRWKFLLPETLERLELLDYSFVLDSQDLPRGLKELILPPNLNNPFDPINLPPMLKMIKIHNVGEEALSNLPKSLESIHILSLDIIDANFIEFKQLKSLIMSSSLSVLEGNLPPSLETLYLNSWELPLSSDMLPDSITNLHFGSTFNQELNCLPKQLKRLDLGSKFNLPIIAGQLPHGLEILKFGTRFNCKLTQGVLPSTLKELIIKGNYNHELEVGVLPTGLKKLVLGEGFVSKIQPGALVNTLQVIKIPKRYPHLLDNILPSSLVKLSILPYEYKGKGPNSPHWILTSIPRDLPNFELLTLHDWIDVGCNLRYSVDFPKKYIVAKYPLEVKKIGIVPNGISNYLLHTDDKSNHSPSDNDPASQSSNSLLRMMVSCPYIKVPNRNGLRVYTRMIDNDWMLVLTQKSIGGFVKVGKDKSIAQQTCVSIIDFDPSKEFKKQQIKTHEVILSTLKSNVNQNNHTTINVKINSNNTKSDDCTIL